MNEMWKPIKGYEERYEVSSIGNVRRIHGTNSGDAGSLLAPAVDRLGYKRVCLCKNGTEKREYVHRLVASAFIAGGGSDVNHINGIKGDDRVENLEWCSHQENMKKAAEIGLIKCKPIAQMRSGKTIKIFASLSEVARAHGYNKSNISKCCNGKRKTAYGYEWFWVNGGGKE